MNNKINIKGGEKNARGDISSYIINDGIDNYIQIYGTIVYEELLPKAKTKELQLYDSLFNPPKTYSFSPRLFETLRTFEYLKKNKKKYYEKLIYDLTYIFYNLSEESGVFVNSYIKNEKKTFQLKEENTYFKIKTMIDNENHSYYDSSYNYKNLKNDHKSISILLCTSDNKINIRDKEKDVELFLFSFSLELDENKNAILSLPEKFNNTKDSYKTVKLDISEKYKILELLQLLTKSNYNFNGDARKDGFGEFVKNEDQFPKFINDIFKNYKTKDLYTTLTEYGKKET